MKIGVRKIKVGSGCSHFKRINFTTTWVNLEDTVLSENKPDTKG